MLQMKELVNTAKPSALPKLCLKTVQVFHLAVFMKIMKEFMSAQPAKIMPAIKPTAMILSA
jgi:hypothetical protein